MNTTKSKYSSPLPQVEISLSNIDSHQATTDKELHFDSVDSTMGFRGYGIFHYILFHALFYSQLGLPVL